MKKEIIKTWEAVAQDYAKLVVPNRPSFDDCKNYGLLIAQILKNKRQPKIMVMGSTPELRSILLTYTIFQKAQVYCLDINPTMYRAMTNFVIKSELKEKYVQKSWLNTGFKDNFFDLVVGDEVICNLPAKEHSKLFKEIGRILKPSGFWITRHNLYLKKESKEEAKKIILDLVKKIESGEYSFQQAINIFHPRLWYYTVSLSPEHKASIGDALKILKEISKKLPQKNILKKLIILIENNFSKFMNYSWSGLSQKESEQELENYFSIKKRVVSKDYITAKFSPIYLLKVKK
ncbi:MAG: class I SAM-dependent methyltransferase [Patescibacteria group bacterium]|nr:class I SAM-dependent methyltransferase [Patescibacteria group bacterium]